MRKILAAEKVLFRGKRPYIKGTHIPVELLIGLGVSEVKKMYPWLKEDQIQDALDFVQEVLNEHSFATNKSAYASAKTKIQTS